jgi:hypothetical protein
VRSQREEAQEYLQLHLTAISNHVGMHGTAFRLQRACGTAPLPAMLDYVRLALDPQVALAANPFLSGGSVARLQQGARVWLQLCVLEDRLGRLAGLVEDPASAADLIQVMIGVVHCPGRSAVASLVFAVNATSTWHFTYGVSGLIHPEHPRCSTGRARLTACSRCTSRVVSCCLGLIQSAMLGSDADKWTTCNNAQQASQVSASALFNSARVPALQHSSATHVTLQQCHTLPLESVHQALQTHPGRGTVFRTTAQPRP